jgi:hypothetical protein
MQGAAGAPCALHSLRKRQMIGHHLNPTVPWYLLRFCTSQPKCAGEYWTHWYRTFVRRELVFMKPMLTRSRQVESRVTESVQDFVCQP